MSDPLPYRSDQEKITMLKNGDVSVTRSIYIDCFGGIEYFILRNGGSEQEAEDIFQDAMIVLFENSRKVNFNLTSSIKTYIHSICRNLWYNQLRKKGKIVTLPDDPEEIESKEFESIDFNEPDERIENILECLEYLGEKCRKLLHLYYYDELDMHLIAAQLSYTNAANAKNQKYKCLVQLKKCVFGGKT